jgi:hypothetical protein
MDWRQERPLWSLKGGLADCQQCGSLWNYTKLVQIFMSLRLAEEHSEFRAIIFLSQIS